MKKFVFVIAFAFGIALVVNAGLFDAVLDAAGDVAKKSVENAVENKVDEAVESSTSKEESTESTESEEKSASSEETTKEESEPKAKPQKTAKVWPVKFGKASKKPTPEPVHKNETGFTNCGDLINAIIKNSPSLNWEKTMLSSCMANTKKPVIQINTYFGQDYKDFTSLAYGENVTNRMFIAGHKDSTVKCYAKYPIVIDVSSELTNKANFDKACAAVESVLPGCEPCSKFK